MTTPKRARPVFARSQTTSPEIAQQHLSSRVSNQAARRLHLRPHHDAKDGPSGMKSSHRQNGHSLHHAPGRVIAEIAKSKAPGTNSNTNTTELIENVINSSAPRDVDSTDVNRERQFQAARDDELRNSLESLTQLATSVTRRLDGIYYAILEKASALRTAVDSLQKLLYECSDLRHTFEQDASDLKDKVQTQIADFGSFKSQQQAVDELESRIRLGTERAHSLNDRLDKARERVRRWEKRESEWQARTSGRIRASIITFLCFIGALIFLLFLRAMYLHSQSPYQKHFNDILASVSIPFNNLQMMTQKSFSYEGPVAQDPRLQLFDEL